MKEAEILGLNYVLMELSETRDALLSKFFTPSDLDVILGVDQIVEINQFGNGVLDNFLTRQLSLYGEAEVLV